MVEAVEKLFACCVPTEETAARRSRSPPLVVLHWGTITSFPAFVTSVSAKYTLFTSDGTPIRAICSVSPGGDARRPGQAEPDVRCARRRAASHRVVAGDTLASVAYREYGDPTLWRPLAAYNGIDDPMRLRAGHRRCCCPAPRTCSATAVSRWRPVSHASCVEIDGTPLPADVAPLLVVGVRRRQPASCPTCSCCASATPTASCWPRPARRSASKVKVSRRSPATPRRRSR